MCIRDSPKTEDYTYKQGQYSPRKRKDTTPKVNPQLAVEPNSDSGHNVSKFRGNNRKGIETLLKNSGKNYIVQGVVEQHPALKAFNLYLIHI